MTDADLLPCPFCGKEAHLVQDQSSAYERNWPWGAYCNDDTCIGGGGCYATKEAAITAWNKRPPVPIRHGYTDEEIAVMVTCLHGIMWPMVVYNADQLSMANCALNQAVDNAKQVLNLLSRNVIPDNGNL